MSEDRLSRYVWFLDTIRRYGRITRKELAERWRDAGFSGASLMPRRTFHTYKNAVEEIFGVRIECDRATYEYYLAGEEDSRAKTMDWMYNNAAVGNMLINSAQVADRIIVEDVPSARNHLNTVLEAIKLNHRIRFTYSSFSRIRPKEGLVLEPYFLKIFRQRWYVTGLHPDERNKGLRTYALDRMTSVRLIDGQFSLPDDFSAADYTADAFGIIFDMDAACNVVLRVTTRRAKYLRALPLHKSQKEIETDSTHSRFSYHLRPTPDLVEELLSMAPDIVVEEPPVLREMLISRLRAQLSAYGTE